MFVVQQSVNDGVDNRAEFLIDVVIVGELIRTFGCIAQHQKLTDDVVSPKAVGATTLYNV